MCWREVYSWGLIVVAREAVVSFVRNAFAGIPTLAKEVLSDADIQHGIETTDIL